MTDLPTRDQFAELREEAQKCADNDWPLYASPELVLAALTLIEELSDEANNDSVAMAKIARQRNDALARVEELEKANQRQESYIATLTGTANPAKLAELNDWFERWWQEVQRATAAEQELERRREIVLAWLEEFKGTRDEFQDEACWAWLRSAAEGDGDATLS